jgi:hypothetical protein
MASNAKTALVFMLLLATVMAAHAKKVSVKNEYCKPITVNGVLIKVDVEVDVDVDVGSLVVEVEGLVEGLLGGVVKEVYSLPSDVTKVAILKNAEGLVAEVLDAVTTLVGSLLDGIILNVDLAVCINL